jgi:hypothetical protein
MGDSLDGRPRPVPVPMLASLVGSAPRTLRQNVATLHRKSKAIQREYSRFFGQPPVRDVRALRESGARRSEPMAQIA